MSELWKVDQVGLVFHWFSACKTYNFLYHAHPGISCWDHSCSNQLVTPIGQQRAFIILLLWNKTLSLSLPSLFMLLLHIFAYSPASSSPHSPRSQQSSATSNNGWTWWRDLFCRCCSQGRLPLIGKSPRQDLIITHRLNVNLFVIYFLCLWNELLIVQHHDC